MLKRFLDLGIHNDDCCTYSLLDVDATASSPTLESDTGIINFQLCLTQSLESFLHTNLPLEELCRRIGGKMGY